ncbi:hypothetical protein JCM3774_006298 [Rhodotorula dairenensis]
MVTTTDESPQQQQQLSILRIKRKRTQQPTPLDALVIEQLEPSTKRRKAATPATEPSATTHSSRGVFKFAETVPLDSFSTPTKTRSLRDRIQSFLSHPPPGLARASSSSSLRSASLAAANSASASPASRRGLAPSTQVHARPGTPPSASDGAPSSAASPRRKLPSALRAARAAAMSTASSSTSSLEELQAASLSTPSSPGAAAAARESAPSPRLSALHAEKSRLRYRVIEQRRAFFSAQAEAAEIARQERAREDDEIRRGLRPPRVVDSRTLATPTSADGAARAVGIDSASTADPIRRQDAGLKIYEAVAEGASADVTQSARSRGSGSRIPGARIMDAGQSAAMDQFGALLDEYLTLQDHVSPSEPIDPHPTASSSSRSRRMPVEQLPASSRSRAHSPAPSSDDESDYVYDVYYRATDAAQKSVQAPGPEGGAVSGSASGWDVSSLAGLDRIGQLAGLAEDSDDEAQLLVNQASAGDSSEEEDNADQDSNEENDYRNDYPDEDEPDSDNNRQEFRDRQADWSEDESDDNDSEGSMLYDSGDDY